MHSWKKSCANLSLNDTIKYLQSESKKKEKYAPPERFPAVRFSARTKGICFTSCSSTMIITNLCGAIFVSSRYSRDSWFIVPKERRKKKKKMSLQRMNVRNSFNPRIFFSFSLSYFADFPNNVGRWRILFKRIASFMRSFSLVLSLICASIFSVTT